MSTKLTAIINKLASMTRTAVSDDDASGNYVVRWGKDVWNSRDIISDDEHEAACERAEAWLTQHEGDDVSISVRSTRRSQTGGIYRVNDNGNEQILGHSIKVPERIQELVDQAWEHALKTWR